MPLVGFDLAGLATFVLCPLVLPVVFVAHWICWAHWCCRLVFWGPLVLSLVLFCPLVLPLLLCGPLVLPLLVCCPTGFAACLFVGPPAGFATDFGNIEQRQDLIILPFTLTFTLYPLRHGRARGGELARREAAALAADTAVVFLVFGVMGYDVGAYGLTNVRCLGFLVRLWGCPERCWCDIGAMMFLYDILAFWNDSG